MQRRDSEEYLKRKRYFAGLLTIFGRLTVLEALQVEGVKVERLHLAKSNKPAPILTEIEAIARELGAEVLWHDRQQLSRISKNAKQDQGVALDIQPAGFQELDSGTLSRHTEEHSKNAKIREYIALDRITNPQNLGMIIRSVSASDMTGLIIPRKGCAKLDALVIKASAGTLFRAPIIRCEELNNALELAHNNLCDIVGLDLSAEHTLSSLPDTDSPRIYVLGNESEGLSSSVQARCTSRVKIPMRNQVESLNVAVTASLIALRHQL